MTKWLTWSLGTHSCSSTIIHYIVNEITITDNILFDEKVV